MEHLREFFLRKMLLNLRNYGTFAGGFSGVCSVGAREFAISVICGTLFKLSA